MAQDYRSEARQLATVLFVLAGISLLPIAFHHAQSFQIHRWETVLACIAAVTAAIATLLYQVTDWSAPRAAAWFTAALALVFAAATAVGLFANGTNRLVIGLDLTSTLLDKRLALWSLFELTCYSAITFALGRCANRWEKAVA